MRIKPEAPLDPESEPSAINKRLAIRCHDLQHQLQTLQHEHKKLQDEQKRLFSDLCAIAESLGKGWNKMGESDPWGISPEIILERIEELKRHASYY